MNCRDVEMVLRIHIQLDLDGVCHLPEKFVTMVRSMVSQDVILPVRAQI
jgi:hypothetical protein